MAKRFIDMAVSVQLPVVLDDLADELARLAGVVAVVIGGSRAMAEADEASDWDLGVYYRGELELEPLARRGQVHPPGSWGRIMNGGAWLTVEGRRVDVLLRDLDVVAGWSARAHAGELEVDMLLGYLAGIPTYSLLAEHAVAVVIRGELPPAPAEFPPRLRAAAPPRWRFHRDFSLDHARSRARRGDVTGAVGLCARAAIEEAHARLCERGQWVLNEKRILERAGIGDIHSAFARAPSTADDLVAWVTAVAGCLRAAAV